MTSSELQKIFSSNIKRERTRLGLSQVKLAEKADLSVGYICDLEYGKRWGTPETFSKLANALNISPYELLLPEDFINGEESAETEKIKSTLIAQIGAIFREKAHEYVDIAVTESMLHAK